VTERVTHAELLSFRRELLESIPVALRERLKDIDHLLGWPPQNFRVRLATALHAADCGCKDFDDPLTDEDDRYIRAVDAALGT
jgi:hypothetical protein